MAVPFFAHSAQRVRRASAASFLRRRALLGLVALSATTACTPEAPDGGAAWPRRPIQISCFAAPGGGTDTVSRLLAKTLADELGVGISVVNRAGGRGGAAIHQVWTSPRDGYSWGGFSESILTAPVLGITDTTAADWSFFLLAGAPGVLSVPAGSRFADLASLVEVARANPDTVKVSAGLTGGIWHTKLLALEEAAGVAFHFIPFNQGSQPSQLAALSGEVDAVLTSISEQAELIRGDELRPLAMVEAEGFDFPERGRIPAAAESYADVRKLPVSQFLGIAVPADTPAEIQAPLAAAFDRVAASAEVRAFARERLLNVLGYHGARARALTLAAEQAWTWKLHELGIAVRSPEDAGIARP